MTIEVITSEPGGEGLPYPTRFVHDVYHGACIETPAGFNYTGADCCAWMKAVSFRHARVEHLVGPDLVVGTEQRSPKPWP
ncbi:hypothetical protein HRbin30_00615 [bacterium HR30]|nr:hypothetical protein HRbin30_00615 [bacterium HR30]